MSEQQQYPTREQIAEAIRHSDVTHVDVAGTNSDDWYLGNADAVLALFPQPTPSAEPTAWEQAAQIAERDAVGVTLADLTKFPAVRSTGARIAFNIRAAAQKNGPATADVLRSQGPHPKVTVLGVNEDSLTAVPPSTANMAPGGTFYGVAYDGHCAWWLVLDNGYVKSGAGITRDPSDIDPSTIRDITPPKDAV